MAHLNKNNKALMTRVKKIQGQVSALEKALDQSNECIAVLQQISAIRGAVNGLMNHVLEAHIRDHLGDNQLSDEQRQHEVDDVVTILKSYLK